MAQIEHLKIVRTFKSWAGVAKLVIEYSGISRKEAIFSLRIVPETKENKEMNVAWWVIP